MIFKPFSPFPYDPAYINVDGSNWAGNFTSNVVPESSLSPLVPGSNILAARASALFGGSRNKNMRLYNRMKRSLRRQKYSRRQRGKTRRGKTRRGRFRGGLNLRGGMNATPNMRGGMNATPNMRGGNAPVRDWITGNSLNNTSFRTPFNLPPVLSALANPVPFFNTSHNL